jgi:hypothetical protein
MFTTTRLAVAEVVVSLDCGEIRLGEPKKENIGWCSFEKQVWFRKEEIINRLKTMKLPAGKQIDDFIEEFCPHLKECSYSWEYEYSNHFLTAKACQEHIDRNDYHSNKPVTYLNHAWRNPEMELVSEFLCGLVGKKMHT